MKLIYTQSEAFDLVEEYTEAYKKQIKELEKDNKNLREKISEITMVADDEKQSIEHILELEEENKKLREENKKLQNDLETVAGAYFDR